MAGLRGGSTADAKLEIGIPVSPTKFIARLGCALALVVTLAACSARPAARSSSGAAATPSGQASPGAARTATPRAGGRATIGVVGDLRAINPAFDQIGLAATLFRPVVEGLFDFDPAGKPRAWLAESVPSPGNGLSVDGKVAIIRLREGVAWEDGRPFTANDVLFTYAASQNPDNPVAPAITSAYRAIRAVDELDSYTVRLTLDQPGDAYLRAFSPIFPAHLFNGQTNLVTHPYARAPFGTGPFRFGEWVPGTSLTLVRSASYRVQGRPYLDTIVFRAFPDQATAEAAMRTGVVDLLLTADGQGLMTPPTGPGAIRDVAPARNVPPTWDAGDWWRAAP
jgi:peptide/nickel transport system substrate-binding protein